VTAENGESKSAGSSKSGKRKRKPNVNLTIEQAAELIVRVHRSPGDKQALLERFSVSLKTLERWVKRAGTDPALSELVRKKTEETEADWAELAQGTMREVLEAISHTAMRIRSKAVPEHGDLRELAGAAKIVGELLTARGILNVGPVRTHRKDQALATTPSGAQPGAASTPPVH
jgi:hypothetical protein